MLSDERRNAIVRQLSLSEHGTASVVELARQFRVSEMTIRRDLEWLQSRALVRRVHGGAVICTAPDEEKPFHERSNELDQEKQAIGRMAARLVRDGETILLDAGTTTRQIVPHLASRQDLTVITNAVPIVQDLAQFPTIRTIILGGLLKHRELCAVGPMVTRELSRLSVDKVFLSTTGFDVERGLTDPDIHEAEVKEAMIGAASEVILVADSSKWHQVSLVRIAPLRTVHVLVTDDGLADDAVIAIEEEGITVITPHRTTSLIDYQIKPGGNNARR